MSLGSYETIPFEPGNLCRCLRYTFEVDFSLTSEIIFKFLNCRATLSKILGIFRGWQLVFQSAYFLAQIIVLFSFCLVQTFVVDVVNIRVLNRRLIPSLLIFRQLQNVLTYLRYKEFLRSKAE